MTFTFLCLQCSHSADKISKSTNESLTLPRFRLHYQEEQWVMLIISPMPGNRWFHFGHSWRCPFHQLHFNYNIKLKVELPIDCSLKVITIKSTLLCECVRVESAQQYRRHKRIEKKVTSRTKDEHKR